MHTVRCLQFQYSALLYGGMLYLVISFSPSPAQWKVHVRRPGVIALQSIHTSENWLAIRDGKTIGNVIRIYKNVILYSFYEKETMSPRTHHTCTHMHTHSCTHVHTSYTQGRGGPYCDFIVQEGMFILSTYFEYCLHVCMCPPI